MAKKRKTKKLQKIENKKLYGAKEEDECEIRKQKKQRKKKRN